jgi:hypothetical protein
MAYIGVSPSNGVRRVHTYTATASQTTFSGAGAEGTTLSYKDSNFVDVYQNGIKLGDADYTSTSGTSIVLAQGASVDDLVVVVVFDVFSVADTVSKADGGTFDGNVTMAGTLDVTGNGTVGGTLGVTGAVTANAGVKVDNITIDGTEIDLSSGDFTLDVAGDISIDAGGGDTRFKHGGTEFLAVQSDNSLVIFKAVVQDKDIQFRGNVGGTNTTMLTLDTSDAGTATFNNGIKIGDGHPNNIGQVKSTSSVSLADDASITIQQATGGVQVVCIYEGSQGAWAIYAVGYGVSSIIAEYAVGTTDFVVGDTDGKACIITSGHTTTFKNRRGATSSYRISSMGVGDFKG